MDAAEGERNRKAALAAHYRAHHAQHRSPGFVYAGRDRGYLLAGWIGRGRRVLDIGCRDGALTSFYADGNEVIGIDIDDHALKACAHRLSVDTVWHDVTSGLPFADESFDAVVAAEVLEHLPLPEFVIAEAARVLRPGGLFVGSVPNAYRLRNRVRVLWGSTLEDDPTHLRQFTPTRLRALLEDHFAAVEIAFLMGRLRWLSGPLLAHDMAWRCQRGSRAPAPTQMSLVEP